MAQVLYINPDPATQQRATTLGCGWMPQPPPQFASAVGNQVPCVVVSGNGTTTVIPEPTTPNAVMAVLQPILNAEQAANTAQAAIPPPPLSGWQTITVAADQIVNNSVTLTNTDLTVPVAANTKYRIRGCAFLDSTAAADVKYSIVGPASPTLVRVHRTQAVAGVAPAMAIIDVALPAGALLAGTATNGAFAKWEMILHNGPNAGNVVFQFAQNTQTNDTGAVLRAGSYIEFARA